MDTFISSRQQRRRQQLLPDSSSILLRPKTRRLTKSLLLLLVILVIVSIKSCCCFSESLTTFASSPETRVHRVVSSSNESSSVGNEDKKNKTVIDCEEAAYKEFPADLFGQWLRSHGFIVIHIAVSCYMFYCLAVVCDTYFLPSLEECSHRLRLSDDVAGATFMAAGSSAPELFTALLGVFVAKGDVGTGTIVGSAVFNILFVIGICGLFVGSAGVRLNWWPVFRDAASYAVTVLVLTLVIWDGRVGRVESAIMLSLYLVYILIMKFNVQLRDELVKRIDVSRWGLVSPSQDTDGDHGHGEEEDDFDRQENYGSSGTRALSGGVAAGGDPLLNAWDGDRVPAGGGFGGAFGDDSWTSPGDWGQQAVPRSQQLQQQHHSMHLSMSLFEAANHIIIRHRRLFRAKTRFAAAANLIIIRNNRKKTGASRRSQAKAAAAAGPSKGTQKRILSQTRRMQMQQQESLQQQQRQQSRRRPSIVADSNISEEASAELNLVPNPLVEGWMPVLWWMANYPLNAILFYTIPDCRKRPALFLLSFLMSILWTAIFSYIMVWMVTLIGFTFGIPDSVMGITLLAAGTSIPDAYASVHVARAGQADMAVSNSIGSNVFDILVGLALPWFIETAMVRPGSDSIVKSMGLVYAVLLLLLTLVAAVGLLHINCWVLNRKLGVAYLAVYCLFLVVAVALEFNLLGDFNPPTC